MSSSLKNIRLAVVNRGWAVSSFEITTMRSDPCLGPLDRPDALEDPVLLEALTGNKGGRGSGCAKPARVEVNYLDASGPGQLNHVGRAVLPVSGLAIPERDQLDFLCAANERVAQHP